VALLLRSVEIQPISLDLFGQPPKLLAGQHSRVGDLHTACRMLRASSSQTAWNTEAWSLRLQDLALEELLGYLSIGPAIYW